MDEASSPVAHRGGPLALGKDQKVTMFNRTAVQHNWRRACLIELAFSIIALSGCVTDTPVPVVDLAPLSAQIERMTEENLRLDRLNHDLDLANRQLKSQSPKQTAMQRGSTLTVVWSQDQKRHLLGERLGTELIPLAPLAPEMVCEEQTLGWQCKGRQ